MKRDVFRIPWFEAIYFCRMRLFYRAVDSGRIDLFLGPEVRGSIGAILKSYNNCSDDQNTDCQVCGKETREHCIYARFFLDDSAQTKGYVLKLDPAYRGLQVEFHHSDTFQVDIVLLGRNIDLADGLLKALRHKPLRLGERGLRFELTEAGFVNDSGKFKPVSELEENLTLKIAGNMNCTAKPLTLELICQTPTEVSITHGQYVHEPERLIFRLLVLRLLERTENIAREHCGWPKRAESRHGLIGRRLIEQADAVKFTGHKAHRKRVKIRNNSGRKTGGLVGSLFYEGNLKPFMGLMDAAVHLGLGRSTTAGFGQVSYRLF